MSYTVLVSAPTSAHLPPALPSSPTSPSQYRSGNKGVDAFLGGDYALAEAEFRKQIRLRPDNGLAHGNLASTLMKLHQIESARYHIHKAIKLLPDDYAVNGTLALYYFTTGEMEKSVKHYDRLLAFQENAQVRHDRSLVLMAMRVPGCWDEYEARESALEAHKIHPIKKALPKWEGQPGRIYVHLEQGLGDQIQFSRYLPELAKTHQVTYSANESTMSLFAYNYPGVTVVPPLCYIESDYHIPLMSLPRFIPEIPPPDIRPIRQSPLPDEFTVGICWRGNPEHVADSRRSMPSNLLASLPFKTVSLQYEDLKPKDWAETAEVISGLHAVASVDTSVLHLAASMGKPTFALLDYHPDWRWPRSGAKSEYYGTIRLLRQRKPLDWRPVLDELIGELWNIQSR